MPRGFKPSARDSWWRFCSLKRVLEILLVGCLVLADSPFAGAQVKKNVLIVGAHVEKAEVTVGEPFTFLITVMGPIQMNPKVNLTAFEGFEILSTGQATQVQIQGVKVQSTLKLTYRLMPTAPGTHTLGPVKVEYQGKAYETEPVTVRVLPGPSEGAPKPETEPSDEPALEGGVVL